MTCVHDLYCCNVCVITEEEGEIARVRHRQRRGMLKMYYGVSEESGKPAVIDYCDINGAHFKPDAFLEKLFKEKSLNELMDKETDISKRKGGVILTLVLLC